MWQEIGINHSKGKKTFLASNNIKLIMTRIKIKAKIMEISMSII